MTYPEKRKEKKRKEKRKRKLWWVSKKRGDLQTRMIRGMKEMQ
jgi:hypothetical protein